MPGMRGRKLRPSFGTYCQNAVAGLGRPLRLDLHAVRGGLRHQGPGQGSPLLRERVIAPAGSPAPL